MCYYTDQMGLIKSYSNQIILISALTGLLISLYLWNVIVTGSEIICATGCDVVLSSQYSKVLGVPVAAFGAAFYAAVIYLTFLRTKVADAFVETSLKVTVWFGVIFTLYLRYLEFFRLGEICEWCWGSVVVLIIITATLILERKKNAK